MYFAFQSYIYYVCMYRYRSMDFYMETYVIRYMTTDFKERLFQILRQKPYSGLSTNCALFTKVEKEF